MATNARKRSPADLVVRDSYLSTKRISAVVEATGVRPVGDAQGWIGVVHRRTDAALGYGLRPQEAAVVRGMVLGDRSLIPEDLDEAFQRSGITHVLVSPSTESASPNIPSAAKVRSSAAVTRKRRILYSWCRSSGERESRASGAMSA